MGERINPFQEKADRDIAGLKARLTGQDAERPLLERLRIQYAADPHPDTTGEVRDATPADIAAALRRGRSAAIPPQERHRKAGGKKKR